MVRLSALTHRKEGRCDQFIIFVDKDRLLEVAAGMVIPAYSSRSRITF